MPTATILSPLQAMSRALTLAKRGRFTVSPNPMVGCVIVKAGQIVGEGFHQYAGEAHAEVHALKAAGSAAQSATAYLTLEPCCHYGQTPPCTTALIQSGIRTIYIACLDPNPLIAGKSIALLRQSGITVRVGLYGRAARQLNEAFFHYMATNRPFVILKWAMSLDGQTVVSPKDTKAISCLASQEAAHRLRQQVDAILIGAKTAYLDNPTLTVRIPSLRRDNKQPWRIVVSTAARELPIDLKLFHSPKAKTILATTDLIDPKIKARLIDQSVEVWCLPKTDTGQVNLQSLLQALGARQIVSLLVEGGMTLHHQFLSEKLANKLAIYLAPVIIGSHRHKQPVLNLTFKRIAHDFSFSAYPMQRGTENV